MTTIKIDADFSGHIDCSRMWYGYKPVIGHHIKLRRNLSGYTSYDSVFKVIAISPDSMYLRLVKSDGSLGDKVRVLDINYQDNGVVFWNWSRDYKQNSYFVSNVLSRLVKDSLPFVI